MPTYEYACGACGSAWETEQRITEAPLKKCPKCGKNSAKRQISGGGAFILKGGGWYADGYASSGKASVAPSKCEGKCETCDVKPTSDDGKKTQDKGTPKAGAAKASAA
jgi:putative FmdB family regulatory protein